jgi:hypothetical protein
MRRLSALLCEKVVQPTGDSYSADHLIFGMGDAVLQESQPRYTAFRHQMFEFDHQPFLDSRRAITTASKKLARLI